MLLTISTTHNPATDLSYLLHKHPARLQSVELSQGNAHVFYPHANDNLCTVALLLDIDPIGLVRKSGESGPDSFSLGQYVNDRPYVASSFISVAIAKAFSTAMNGKCENRPNLVELTMPFDVAVSVIPSSKGDELLIRKLFEPLGYTVSLEQYILDPKFPEWGQSKYFTLKLSGNLKLKELLSHLYVLIPVLDNEKHYWIGQHEVEKLLQKGEGWLKGHRFVWRQQIIKNLVLILILGKNEVYSFIATHQVFSIRYLEFSCRPALEKQDGDHLNRKKAGLRGSFFDLNSMA